MPTNFFKGKITLLGKYTHAALERMRCWLTLETLPAWLYVCLPLIGLYDLTQETYVVEVAGIALATAFLFRLRHRIGQVSRWTVCDVCLVLYMLYEVCNGGVEAPVRIQDNGIAGGMMYFYVRLLGPSVWSMQSAVLFIAGGLLQTGIGLLQLNGTVPSLHHDFAATGSFGNPASWAGYLCISSLIALTVWHTKCSQRAAGRRLLFAVLGVLLYGLLAADSRAAWLAFGCGAMGMLVLRQHTSSARLRAAVVCCLVAAVGTAMLYTYRTASADARLLIWKVGSRLFLHHPLTGTGVNGFAANYLPAQGIYLEDAGTAERLLASDNLLAYNEWFRIGCEQGLIGLLLLGAVTCRLLYKAADTFRLRKSNLFPPFVGWCVFSCFSYPMEEPTLALLFPLLLGLTVNSTIPSGRGTVSPVVRCSVYVCVLSVAGFLAYNCVMRYRANRYLDSLFFEEEMMGYYVAPENESFIFRDTRLLSLYTTVWMINENYSQALRGMEVLQTMAPSTRLLLDQGTCLEAVGRYRQAADKYKMAVQWVPGLLTPRFRLFMLYRRQGNTAMALKLAQDVVRCLVKQEDKRTFQMREAARSFILSLSE